MGEMKMSIHGSITRSDGRLVGDWTDRLNPSERRAYYAARQLEHAIEERARIIGNNPIQLPEATERADVSARKLADAVNNLRKFYASHR